jgi:hypothetical protein
MTDHKGKLMIGMLAACIALAGAGYAFYQFSYPAYIYRQRMIVEVEAGGQLRTGSSVIEITVRKQPKFGDTATALAYVRGEAVFVDLGQGRNVVALLTSGPNGNGSDYPHRLVTNVFGVSYEDRDLPKLAALRDRSILLGEVLPTFVTVADLNDPTTARIVAPREFEKVLGSDVHFKGAWIEMTDGPVTKGIEQKMPMLTTHKDEMRRVNDDMPPRFQPHFEYFVRN